jgi:uncharacterized membrane protein YedE/YeeE
MGKIMTEFTPVSALAGGVLIGVAALALMALNGRIAGISGILGGLLPPSPAGENLASDKGWRIAFLAGLAGAAFLYIAFTSTEIVQSVSTNLTVMTIAGLLVGFGSALGSGCTSGHGVCGMSRMSIRSIAATFTFMATGAIMVFVMRHLVGG